MAVLKFKTKEEIPDDLREHAEEIKDEGAEKGQWKVKVAADKKLGEFRDNNVELRRKVDALTDDNKIMRGALGLKDEDKFDSEKFTTELTGLRETQKLVNDGKLTKSDAIEAELEKRTTSMRQSLEDGKNAALQAATREKARADELEGKLKRGVIDRAVYEVCSDAEMGIHGWAAEYIQQLAYGLYSVDENNKLVPKENGSVVYGDSGSEPMTVKEWVENKVRKAKPQFFKTNVGGGATGGGDATKFGGMSEKDFMDLPPEKRLEIVNAQTAKKGYRAR